MKMEIKRYLLRLFLIYYSRFKEFDGQYNLEQLGTYSPLTHRSLTHLLTHSLDYLLTGLLTYSLTRWLTYSLAYSHTG